MSKPNVVTPPETPVARTGQQPAASAASLAESVDADAETSAPPLDEVAQELAAIIAEVEASKRTIADATPTRPEAPAIKPKGHS